MYGEPCTGSTSLRFSTRFAALPAYRRLQVDGLGYEGVPLYDCTDTGPAGVRGPLSLPSAEGAILVGRGSTDPEELRRSGDAPAPQG